MSGGSFDYAYSKLHTISDDIIEAVMRNIDSTNAMYTDSGFSSETRQLTEKIANITETLGDLLRTLEWVWSGDFSESDLSDGYAEFVKNLKKIME
jgi:hypothetical protein